MEAYEALQAYTDYSSAVIQITWKLSRYNAIRISHIISSNENNDNNRETEWRERGRARTKDKDRARENKRKVYKYIIIIKTGRINYYSLIRKHAGRQSKILTAEMMAMM